MNIYEKMAAVSGELQTVAKNLVVKQTKTSSYKAVSERDILDAVKPLETKYGIYSYPFSREVLESNLLESESENQGKFTKKTTFMTRIKTLYRFVNIEKPEEFIETTTFAEGIDSQDKGSGKAMTYADKYALMKAYKISTGDDPDQTASGEVSYTATRRRTNSSGGKRSKNPNVTKEVVDEINKMAEDVGQSMSAILAHYRASSCDELTNDEYTEVIRTLAIKKRKLEASRSKEDSLSKEQAELSRMLDEET